MTMGIVNTVNSIMENNMSYIEKLFVKRDNLEKYISLHRTSDNQIVLTRDITDRLIQE